ncbi:hypothetical protein C8R46DRAFT_1205419 [Mycena filopes]|nr:hypothetical protein C8R46DRAFT_1205419 [Mycena filopes]
MEPENLPSPPPPDPASSKRPREPDADTESPNKVFVRHAFTGEAKLEIDRLEQENRALDEQLGHAKEAVDFLNTKVNESEYADAVDELNATSAELEKARAELEEARAHLEETARELCDAEADRGELETRCAALLKERAELNDELRAAQAKIAASIAVQSALADARNELSHKALEIDSLKNVLQQNSTEITSLKKDHEALQQARLREPDQSTTTAWQKDRAALQQAQMELAKKSTSISELSHKVQMAEQLIRRLYKQQNEMDCTIKSMQAELSQAQRDREHPSTSGSANQQQPIPSHHGVGLNAGHSSNSGGFGGVPAPSVFGGHSATPSTTSSAPSPSTSGSANQQQPIPSHHGVGFNAGHSSNSGGFGGVPAPSFPGFSATPSSTSFAPSPSTSGSANQQQPIPSHHGVGFNAGHASNSGGFGGVPAPSVFGGHGATPSTTSSAPSPSTSGSANQQQPIPSHHGVGFNAGHSSNPGGFGGVPAPSVFGGHGATPSTTSSAPSPSTSGSANQQQPIPSHHGVGFNAGHSSNPGGFGGVPAPSVFGGHGATPSTTSSAPSPSTSGSANQQQPIPSHHGVGFNAGHSSNPGGFGGVPAPSFPGFSATPSSTSFAPSPSTSGSANQQQPIPSHHGAGFNAGHSSNSGGFGGVPAPSFPGFSASSATPSSTPSAPSPSMSSTSGSGNGSGGPPSTSAPEWAPGRPSDDPEQPKISKPRGKRNVKAQPVNDFKTAFLTSEQLAAFNNGAGGPQIGQTPYALLINAGPAENAWNTAVGTLVISEYIKQHRHHYIDLTAESLRILWNTRMTSVRKSHLELSKAPDPAAFLTKKQRGSRRSSSRGTLLARRKATGLSKHLAPAVQTDLAVVFEALTGECMSSDDEGQGGNKRTKETTVVRKDYRHCNLINLMKWLDYFATHHGLNASGVSTGRGVHPRLRLPGATSLGRKITGGLPVNFYNAAYLSSLSEFDRQKLDTKPAIFLPMYVLGWPSNNEFTHDPNDQDEYWRPQRRE